MTKRVIMTVLLAIAATVAVPAVWLASGRESATRAQGETVEMGIDPEVTGNTAASLGTLEPCVRLDVPSPAFDGVSDYDIDVYVQGATAAPMAYDAWVTYDATKVHIAAPGTSVLMKLPPGAGAYSDAVPDTDGRFTASGLYPSGGPGIAGDGVLVRLGLDIGASGVVTFGFDAPPAATAYVSESGEQIITHPVTRRTAQLAINEDCPPAPVAPGATPVRRATPPITPASTPRPEAETGPRPTPAQGEAVEMGIDPEVTGNTASSLGTLEDCVRLDVPSPAFDGVSDHDIDVYVQGDTQAPAAYDAWVTYDAAKVHIAAPGTGTLIKLPGAWDFSDGLPDSDGRFVASAVYLGDESGAAGDGVLVRLGLDVGGSGVVTFDFDAHPAATGYVSASGDQSIMHAITRRTARLAINEDCPAGGQEATATATATPAVTAEPTPEPTPPATTPQVAPGLRGCPDCVKAGEQLRVTAADIQLDPDGKYYVPDRGDGCAYRETGRDPEVMLWAPGCEMGWAYEPTTGRLNPVIP